MREEVQDIQAAYKERDAVLKAQSEWLIEKQRFDEVQQRFQNDQTVLLSQLEEALKVVRLLISFQ